MTNLELATEATRTTYAAFNQEQKDAVAYRTDAGCETLDEAVDFINFLVVNDRFDD